VTAFKADTQMKPGMPGGQALLAAIDDFRKTSDLHMGPVRAENHRRLSLSLQVIVRTPRTRGI
jgi:hypothetical protein